jgi:hypothetical protein
MTTKPISEEHLAYIAGLLDSRGGEVSKTGWVTFSHESKKLIDFLEEHVDGSYTEHSDLVGLYIWKLAPEKSRDLLKSILPFLIRNKNAAKTALELS